MGMVAVTTTFTVHFELQNIGCGYPRLHIAKAPNRNGQQVVLAGSGKLVGKVPDAEIASL
jgi:hypothetical protein